MHETICGVEAPLKLTTKAVGLFNRYKHKGKLTIRINTVVSRTNYESLATLPDLAHELGADGINFTPVDDHCGEILSMRKKDIEKFNNEVAPRIAERALELGLIVSDEDAFPFGRDESRYRLGRAGKICIWLLREASLLCALVTYVDRLQWQCVCVLYDLRKNPPVGKSD